MVKLAAFKEQNPLSDFPIICETCLGPNPYVRMMKKPNGAECKVCAKVFTVYKWKPGEQARYKKTEICPTCSKLKNTCQTCILDLEYNLPVQVRDSFMPNPEVMTIPQSQVNRNYFTQQAEQRLADGDPHLLLPYGKAPPAPQILRLARNTPYYQRNRPHVCSFFVKGTCNRGAECPYLHEIPDRDPNLAKQNIKDRYYGNNDPVANKMLKRVNKNKAIVAPEDTTITTLYIGGITTTVTEQDIRDKFYVFGEIRSVRVLPQKSCAFVTYANRMSAERAVEQLADSLVIKGTKMKLLWAKPKEKQAESAASSAAEEITPSVFNLLPPPTDDNNSGPMYESQMPMMGSSRLGKTQQQQPRRTQQRPTGAEASDAQPQEEAAAAAATTTTTPAEEGSAEDAVSQTAAAAAEAANTTTTNA